MLNCAYMSSIREAFKMLLAKREMLSLTIVSEIRRNKNFPYRHSSPVDGAFGNMLCMVMDCYKESVLCGH